MPIRRLSQLICFVAALAGTTLAATSRDLTPEERKRFDEAAHALIAPCCWREPIAIHRSPEALQMLEEVKQQIMAGRSNQEIESFYVARYGMRILADPPGQTSVLLCLIFLGFACVLLVLLLQLRAPVKQDTADLSPASADFIARVRADTNEGWM